MPKFNLSYSLLIYFLLFAVALKDKPDFKYNAHASIAHAIHKFKLYEKVPAHERHEFEKRVQLKEKIGAEPLKGAAYDSMVNKVT